MTENKFKDELQELEKAAGGKRTPPGRREDDNFQTRELSLEEVEKMKLKIMKEKSGDISVPFPPDPPLPPIPDEPHVDAVDQLLPPPPDEDALQEEIPEDQIPEEDTLKVTDELPPISSEHVSEFDRKFTAPPGPTMSSMTRTLLIVVAALLVVMLYFMFRQKETPVLTVTEPASEEQGPAVVTEDLQPQDEGASTETVPVPSDKEEAPPVFELSDDVFQGVAPMEVRQAGPVISVEVDPEIAAVVDALKVRVDIINGTKTADRAGIITKVTSGMFQGFNIINTHQQKGGEVIKNETVVITPSKGKIIVKDNFLDSLWKIDHEKFKQDLETAGLEIIKKEMPDEGVLYVQLRVTKVYGKLINPEYLVGRDSVGSIKLEMPIEEMKTVLSSGNYTVVDKTMLQDETYYNTYKVLDHRNEPLFFVTGKDNKVWGIQLLSDRFKTAAGIGLGNTLGELRLFYLKNGKVTVSSTPAGSPFVSVETIDGRFFLQGEGLDLKKPTFPDSLTISTILLGGSPFIR